MPAYRMPAFGAPLTKPFLPSLLGVLIAFAFGALITVSDTSARPPAGGSSASEPVLVELFTSQGCSSCPPADQFANMLSRHSELVVISRPVTYWDRLGWKDTLALPANTDLQRAYARKGLAGRNGVYTPQIVVSGRYGAVGSRQNAVHAMIGRAASLQKAAIRTKRLANGSIAVGIAGVSTGRAQLSLMAVKANAPVAIARGENSGRTIAYTNALRSERVLGQWSGGKHGVIVEPAALKVRGADRYALVLRAIDPRGGSGEVLAARWVS